MIDQLLRDGSNPRQVLEDAGIDPGWGLTEDEAIRRRRPAAETGSRTGALVYAARQARDPMVLLLVGAAVVALGLGELVDAAAVLVIVVLNGCFGALQEFRADRAVAALEKVAPARARVRRQGEVREIDSEEVVVGDLILVSAGDRIPADVRWLEAVELRVDESLLTGESLAVHKRSAPLVQVETAHEDAAPTEREDLGSAGTLVTRGRGEGVTFAVGDDTAAGRIGGLLSQDPGGRTPLHLSLQRLGRSLTLAVGALAVVVFLAGVAAGEPPSSMVLLAVSLAVAALPEALPAVVTASLALGSRRMVRRNALVRRLAAAEALGAVSVIASDKTGTLTVNRMTVERIWTVEGWQPADAGALTSRHRPVLEAMLLNNDSNLEGSEWKGDPTEVALARLAHGAGLDPGSLPRRIAEVPFDSDRKRMTTVHAAAEGALVVTKGSPEEVVSCCALTDEERRSILEAAGDAAAEGFRLLAFATRVLDRPATAPPPPDQGWEEDLAFLALAALRDPVRPGVEEAIGACRLAGIDVVMITGDHPDTALSVARSLGITDGDGRVVTGAELDDLDLEGLTGILEETRVFARVTPEHKVRILEGLQARGALVAMTGDGVNDAPALKRANVGVAMGKRGTDVAREAADLILLDDDFTTIVAAVEEGRRIFDNIQRFVRYTLTSNLGEVAVMCVAPLLGYPLPLLPVQILWINLVTDGLPGLALGVEPASDDAARRPPRPAGGTVLTSEVRRHILVVGSAIAVLVLAVQTWALEVGIEHWQTWVFCTLTFAQLAQAWALRARVSHRTLKSLLPLGIALCAAALLQLATVYVPFLQPVFRTQALGPGELGAVLGVSLLVLPFTALLRRRGH